MFEYQMQGKELQQYDCKITGDFPNLSDEDRTAYSDVGKINEITLVVCIMSYL